MLHGLLATPALTVTGGLPGGLCFLRVTSRRAKRRAPPAIGIYVMTYTGHFSFTNKTESKPKKHHFNRRRATGRVSQTMAHGCCCTLSPYHCIPPLHLDSANRLPLTHAVGIRASLGSRIKARRVSAWSVGWAGQRMSAHCVVPQAGDWALRRA